MINQSTEMNKTDSNPNSSIKFIIRSQEDSEKEVQTRQKQKKEKIEQEQKNIDKECQCDLKTEDGLNGRWSKEEHNRFIEAILLYSNDWKKIKDYIGTRTGTQVRSHAQKFLIKLRKNQIFKKKDIDFNLSLGKVIQTIKNKCTNEEFKEAFKDDCNKNKKKQKNNRNDNVSEYTENTDAPVALRNTNNRAIFKSNDIIGSNFSYSTSNTYANFEFRNDFCDDFLNRNVLSSNKVEDTFYINNFIENFNKKHCDFDLSDDDSHEINQVFYKTES